MTASNLALSSELPRGFGDVPIIGRFDFIKVLVIGRIDLIKVPMISSLELIRVPLISSLDLIKVPMIDHLDLIKVAIMERHWLDLYRQPQSLARNQNLLRPRRQRNRPAHQDGSLASSLSNWMR